MPLRRAPRLEIVLFQACCLHECSLRPTLEVTVSMHGDR